MIRKKTKLPNADEATRQHVLDEAPEKFHRGEGHRATLTLVGVVLPTKRHALPIERDQAMIADGDAMCVPTEVAQHGSRPAERRFRVDDPIGTEQRIYERVPAVRVTKNGGRAVEIELAVRVRAAQPFDEFAAKHSTQDFHQ